MKADGGCETRSGAGGSSPVLARRCAALAAAAAAAALSVAAPAHAGRGWIEDPTGRSGLQVSFRDQPSYEDLAETEAALQRTASILCDATEGQVHIDRIRLLSSPESADLAALWIHDGEAASGGPYDAGGNDLHRLGAHMDVFSSARLRPDRLAHLLAHHMFGLGDQYDDQRRRGGACGIGPGFEKGQLDEKNHSIMQGAGGMRCSEGALLGQDCLRDDECAGAPCKAVLASEFSTPENHDLLRGDATACPRPNPATRIRFVGVLPSRAEPQSALDATDFLSARATSAWHQEVALLGSSGTPPGLRLEFFLAHPSRLAWQLTVAADASEFGGPKGKLAVLRSWTMTFHDNFSLATVEPPDLRLVLPPTQGRGPAETAIDIGTRNPDAAGSPGQGYDGLQMVAAGAPRVSVTFDGVAGCGEQWCASSWNSSRGRWELSEQSLLHHGASDWQTLTTNYPFLVAPQGTVNEDAPASCDAPVHFYADVMGTDQVVFVLDTSRSMGMRVDGKPGEVCANSADDDADGETDEADCADSRLEYERIAVRGFLALASNPKLQVGVVAMQTDAETVSEVRDASGGRGGVLSAVLASLKAEGDTAVGSALEKAQEALAKVEHTGRSRTVILISDGVNNVGVVPGQEERKLDPILYRVDTVAIGHAADGLGLSAIAARSGGHAFSAMQPTAVPGILAELAAHETGNALVLARTDFDLAAPATGAPRDTPAIREFPIDVEEKAHELEIFLGTRNDRIDDWRLLYELVGPDGERLDESSPQSHSERGFSVLRVPEPRPGRWLLRVMPGAHALQKNEVLAFTVQDNADLFADADPRLASVAHPVHLSARTAYVTDIDGDVSVQGSVRRPDGSEVPVTFARDPITQDWGADFNGFAGRGLYEVRVAAAVAARSQPALGEPIFPGPARALVRVVPFARVTTASFFVADGPWPACSSDDCDEDGLPDRLENVNCPDDVDGDGIPNRYDADSDNDEIFDGEEGTADLDHNGVPDFCDPEKTPDSLSAVIDAEEAARAGACDADGKASRDSLRFSLSALRRIVQVVRTRPGIPPEVRADLVSGLDKVVGIKKQAVVIADVLPEFCQKYQGRLDEALAIERDLRVRVDPYLVK
ncbi:MAG TPA: vWA domain-containing protein [Candidatus Binatia bacterium]|jgi:hypothetical protein